MVYNENANDNGLAAINLRRRYSPPPLGVAGFQAFRLGRVSTFGDSVSNDSRLAIQFIAEQC
jgi:hypothetical protein